jgi:hypothetical protein
LWGLLSSSPFALIGAIWTAPDKRERIVVSIVLAFVGVSVAAVAGYWVWKEFIYSPPPIRLRF